MWYQYTHTLECLKLKSDNTEYWQEYEAMETYLAGRSEKWYNHLEKNLFQFLMLSTIYTFWPSNSNPKYLPLHPKTKT